MSSNNGFLAISNNGMYCYNILDTNIYASSDYGTTFDIVFSISTEKTVNAGFYTICTDETGKNVYAGYYSNLDNSQQFTIIYSTEYGKIFNTLVSPFDKSSFFFNGICYLTVSNDNSSLFAFITLEGSGFGYLYKYNISSSTWSLLPDPSSKEYTIYDNAKYLRTNNKGDTVYITNRNRYTNTTVFKYNVNELTINPTFEPPNNVNPPTPTNYTTTLLRNVSVKENHLTNNTFIKGIATDYSGRCIYICLNFLSKEDGESVGIFRSLNYGEKWENCLVLGQNWSSITTSSTGQFVFASINDYPGGLIYYSGDYGTTWNTIQYDQGWLGIQTTAEGDSIYAFYKNTTTPISGSILLDDKINNIYFYKLTAPFSPVACFNEDAKILCNICGQDEYIPIKNIRKGYLIKTSHHGYKFVEIIGYRNFFNPCSDERIKDQLYVCSQERYPEVFEDLVITGCHSILVNDFINQEQRDKTQECLNNIYITDDKYRLPACVDERSRIHKKTGIFTVYHIALENDNYYNNYGIYANGLLVETCSKRYLKELAQMVLIE
jgi:hypothetical protein